MTDPAFVRKKGGGGLRLLGFGGFKKLLLAALPILDIIKICYPPKKKKLIWYFFNSFTLFYFFLSQKEGMHMTPGYATWTLTFAWAQNAQGVGWITQHMLCHRRSLVSLFSMFYKQRFFYWIYSTNTGEIILI